MEINVSSADEPQAAVTGAPALDSDVITPTAVVAAPPAPVVTEPPAPVSMPDPLLAEPAPAFEPPTDSPQPAMTNEPTPPDTPLSNTVAPAKKKKPMLIIVIAIIVVMAIGFAAVYAYMRSHRGTPTPAVSKSTTAKVTSNDVNSTSQAVDKSLQSVDDSKDFTSNDVTDQTLGL